MRKSEYLAALRQSLAGLPREELEERLAFYAEMIDDRVEEGLTEEDAVAQIGAVDDVAAQILSEIPLSRLVREKVRAKHTLRGWEIVLLVLGFPVWFPILAALFAVAFTLYIVLWVLVIVIFAVVVALLLSAIAGIAAALFSFVPLAGHAQIGCVIGAALVCVGIAILLWNCGAAAARGIAAGTKKLMLGVKARIAGKENER